MASWESANEREGEREAGREGPGKTTPARIDTWFLSFGLVKLSVPLCAANPFSVKWKLQPFPS